MEAGAQARPQLAGGPRRHLVGRRNEDHLSGRKAAELVFDRLDQTFVADPGLGLDPRCRQGGDADDQALLRVPARRLYVGGPAVEEADMRWSQHHHLGCAA